MTQQNNQDIYDLLRGKVLNKLRDYNPETQAKPFHVALLGEEHVAVHSFVHSVYTMLGQSVFEQIAVIVATGRFDRVERQYLLRGRLSNDAVIAINNLLGDLRLGVRLANIEEENEIIRRSAIRVDGQPFSSKVDVYCERAGERFCFELKSVKPNIDIFRATKEKLLKWKAAHYSARQDRINTYCALPYNPEAPDEYNRFTLQGIFDVRHELLVENDFWGLLGGESTYEELLEIFSRVGEESRELLNRIIDNLNQGEI